MTCAHLEPLQRLSLAAGTVLDARWSPDGSKVASVAKNEGYVWEPFNAPGGVPEQTRIVKPQTLPALGETLALPFDFACWLGAAAPEARDLPLYLRDGGLEPHRDAFAAEHWFADPLSECVCGHPPI